MLSHLYAHTFVAGLLSTISTPRKKEEKKVFKNFHIQHIANIIFPFQTFHSITLQNWNIITFLLVMVVCITQKKTFSFLSSCFGIKPRKINCGPMTFEFFMSLFSIRCTFLRDTFTQCEANNNRRSCHRFSFSHYMMDVLNYLMKIMIM